MKYNETKLEILFNEFSKEKLNNRDCITTPFQCVKEMINYIPKEFWNKKNIKIAEPCCGFGNFGAYISLLTDINNIYFNDIDLYRIQKCKEHFSPKNIFNKDVFEFLKEHNEFFDLIITNPPYSGGGNKNKSISNKIIESSIDALKPNGYLCFITPNNWMTYNNNNTTLKKLLTNGTFLVIDNQCKKYFPQVGSSFTIFLWQKDVFTNETIIKNNYLLKDEKIVKIPSTTPFIPLYISQEIFSIISKSITTNPNNLFNYRCDLHNTTHKELLNDIKSSQFPYPTIHTTKTTRYSSIKQDIFDDFNILIPLSTYFKPIIFTNFNVTHSVGYINFKELSTAQEFLMNNLSQPHIKLLIHLTRYGNFNNVKLLKTIILNKRTEFTEDENKIITTLTDLIKY